MKKIITILIILLFPLKVFAYSSEIIPGGENIGIEVNNKGIIIIGFYKIDNKYNTNNLKVGDIIKKINDKNIDSIKEMINEIEKNVKDNKIKITVIRNKEEITEIFNLIKVDGVYKTGLYVKDSISGIGTLTYIDPNTKIYGALGHEIIESNSMISVEVKSGTIFESLVTSIDRSTYGSAGTKNAKFYSNNIFGSIEKNTISGIYGIYKEKLPNKDKLTVGNPKELEIGSAEIYTVINNQNIEKFKINITKITKDTKTKNIYFEVIDEELNEKTGGIVQGMSGSPIIQNNKIFGAVTHVIVSNPTTGYGIFITTMLKEGEK